jgi:hypothetical protein
MVDTEKLSAASLLNLITSAKLHKFVAADEVVTGPVHRLHSHLRSLTGGYVYDGGNVIGDIQLRNLLLCGSSGLIETTETARIRACRAIDPVLAQVVSEQGLAGFTLEYSLAEEKLARVVPHALIKVFKEY